MSVITSFLAWVKHVFQVTEGDVLPAIENFITRFTTDAGRILLASASAFAEEVLSGKNIQLAGAELVATLIAQGVTAAEEDAKDAIRIQMNYLQSQVPVAAPVVAPVVVPVAAPEVAPGVAPAA